jgi:uracil phosphoribosyltransferase
MNDSQYAQLPTDHGGLAHHYGPRVHLLSHPWAMSLLARLCQPETVQPQINHLVGAMFTWMMGTVADGVLAREQVSLPTRMATINPEAIYTGERIRRDQRIVVVDVARAGILPSHHIYEALHHVVDADGIRQDHVVASRTTDGEGQVTGVTLDGSKIGGPVEGATVIIPDPMGATGSSIAGVIRHYRKHAGGTPARIAVLHLIITPEYIRRITTEFPEVEIFAIRLDRGLSPADVLATAPGERWGEERGLNDTQYIVPGAGGVGELLNNAWV